MRFWGKDRKQDNRKNIWIEHLNIDTGNWFQVDVYKRQPALTASSGKYFENGKCAP